MRIVAAVNARTVDSLWSVAEAGYLGSGLLVGRIASAFRIDPIRQLATVLVGLSVATLFPGFAREVPARVVYAPGQGWVDAANVAGLPLDIPDGAVLRYAWSFGHDVGAAVAGVDTDSSGTTASYEGLASSESELVAGQVALGGKVSLNGASQDSLEGLPGVGPALAARIVAGRPYRSIQDLDRVKGIGPKTIAKLASLIEP